MKRQLKFGFDIHGVLDSFPIYAEMTQTLFDDGHEIHIITGQKRDDLVEQQLKNLGVVFTDYFSIAGWIEDNFPEDMIEWRGGLPYAPPEIWNPAKAAYCRQNSIDIIFDDSPIYGKFFNDINTVYNYVQNSNRRIYDVRVSD